MLAITSARSCACRLAFRATSALSGAPPFPARLRAASPFGLPEPHRLNWSTAMVSKGRTRNGEQATQARRDRHQATAG
jgi:hypothetical protein